MSRLKDRIAVVSGAATGIGKAAAVRLAAEGAIVEILDLKDAAETVNQIRAASGQANAEICDVTSEEQIAKAVAAIAARHSRVDILVNNAGILSGKTPWHELSCHQVCPGGCLEKRLRHVFAQMSLPARLQTADPPGTKQSAQYLPSGGPDSL